VCIALCTIVAHNIARNRPDSFPPYPPDNHHCSDDVYLREGRFGLGDCVRWGPSAPLPKKGAEPSQFLAHVCCGQTAGWIKMVLGMEVGLGPGLDRDPPFSPGHIVLGGDPASPAKKGTEPHLVRM